MERAGILLVHSEVITDSLGAEGYYLVESDPEPVKRLMVELEDCDSFTRFFDIDVIDENGLKLSRQTLRIPPAKMLSLRRGSPCLLVPRASSL